MKKGCEIITADEKYRDIIPRAEMREFIQHLQDRSYGFTIIFIVGFLIGYPISCLLYTSPSPRDKRQARMPSSA